MVKDLLEEHHPHLTVALEIITTSGDWKPSDGEVRLSEKARGKAQFAKEIEEKLLSRDIDIAVHSMKDMDSILPEGLEIACILPREDVHDVILLRDRTSILKTTPIQNWPAGTTIGSSSVRRQAMLLALNSDLNIVTLRGNVETRISKLRGDFAPDHLDLDATLLAVAGLKRLGLETEIDRVVEEADMIAAAAQGAIGIEIISTNGDLKELLKPLNCIVSQMRVVAERAVLKTINGSCHTPIGVHAYLDDESMMKVKAKLLSLDGTHAVEAAVTNAVSTAEDAADLGKQCGEKLIAEGAEELLDQSA